MLGGKRKTPADGSHRARGAGKNDILREALASSTASTTPRSLVDVLCADDTLPEGAAERIRYLAGGTLSASDLAGLLAFRVEKLRQLVASGDLTAERELTGWDKLGVFATSVVQLQAAQTSASGAQIAITWGGFAAPPAPAGRPTRKSDPRIGDIVDTE